MAKWEYMTWLVTYSQTFEGDWMHNHGGFVQYIDGEPVKDWKSARLPAWLKQAGDEGWELVGFQHPGGRHGLVGPEVGNAVYTFKRPKD